MKYLILLIALISTLSAEFDWPGDYDEALAQAKVEKKDVYLFIGAANCKYCEKFENRVLVKDEVIKKLKKDFVYLYLSRDIDDIPSKFETRAVPRHYFLTANGEIIHTTIGSRNIEEFYELLDDVKVIKED